MILGGLLVMLVASFLPLDRSMSLPAILAPTGDQAVITAEPAIVKRVLVRNGDSVKAGQLLMELSSPALDRDALQSRLRMAQLERQIARGVADAKDRASLRRLNSTLLAERERWAGLMRRHAALTPRATIEGQVVDQPGNLYPGIWAGGQAPLLRIITPHNYDVRAYAAHGSEWRLHVGVVGRFVPDDAMAASWRVRLDEVAGITVSHLDQLLLASRLGGPITVKRPNSDLAPQKTMLVLHLIAEHREVAGLARPILGRVSLPVEGESLAVALWRSIAQVLVRETSV
jgi:putative peptide zinc metalloprotease protein